MNLKKQMNKLQALKIILCLTESVRSFHSSIKTRTSLSYKMIYEQNEPLERKPFEFKRVAIQMTFN